MRCDEDLSSSKIHTPPNRSCPFCACEASTKQVYSPPYVSKGVKRRSLISSEPSGANTKSGTVNQPILILNYRFLSYYVRDFIVSSTSRPESNCFANRFSESVTFYPPAHRVT